MEGCCRVEGEEGVDLWGCIHIGDSKSTRGSADSLVGVGVGFGISGGVCTCNTLVLVVVLIVVVVVAVGGGGKD